MVTRDRAALAARAVACFAAQSWPARELVIVDDGTEDYEPMLEPFRRQGVVIAYHRLAPEAGRRLGALRNVAIELAQGQWCIQWDDDEWYDRERIAVQMAAVAPGTEAVALRWTLVHIATGPLDAKLGRRLFRADTGVATPGTVLHRRDAARYPNLARGEDSAFLREVRRHGQHALVVLDRRHSHLFVRCYHGANTWEARHFVRRLHRRPADWPAYAIARWWHRDLTRHPAFRLSDTEQRTARALLAWPAAQPATAARAPGEEPLADEVPTA